MLGAHWTGVVRGCTVPLREADALAAALVACCDALALTRVGAPVARSLPDGSAVAFTLLSASHASIHVPPTGADCWADLFSCAPFDGAACAAAFREALGAASVEGGVVAR